MLTDDTWERYEANIAKVRAGDRSDAILALCLIAEAARLMMDHVRVSTPGAMTLEVTMRHFANLNLEAPRHGDD